LEWKQYKQTNHHRAPIELHHNSDGTITLRKVPIPKGRKKLVSSKYEIWVTTLDAFFDCQLRTHEDLQEKVREGSWLIAHEVSFPPLMVRLLDCFVGASLQLRKRGANFEWKKQELLRRVKSGLHTVIKLKDGSAADMIIVDEAQVSKHECRG